MEEFQELEFLEKLNDRKIFKPVKISKENFSNYGDLISTNNIKPIDINDGYAKRFD